MSNLINKHEEGAHFTLYVSWYISEQNVRPNVVHMTSKCWWSFM